MMADENSDFSFDDVVAQLDDMDDGGQKKSVEVVGAESSPEEGVFSSHECDGVETGSPNNVDEENPVSVESSGEDSSIEESVEQSFSDGGLGAESKDSSESDSNIGQGNSVSSDSDSGSAVDGSSALESSVDAVHDEPIPDGVPGQSLGTDSDGQNVVSDFNPLDPASVGRFLEDMGVPHDVVESKKCLIDVMQRENELLDKILETQTELHDFVREKNWECLSEKLAALQDLSDTFADLEEERETLCELIDMRTDSDFSPVLTEVRGKLQRSKIENHALNEYISTTRKFLQGVFDSVVPQRRNVLYSKNGKIVRPELSGVAVNISL